jgi:hypothetical protein
MDETWLEFRCMPSRTLSDKTLKGHKQQKERITVSFCCNADGTHKLMPTVIGKTKSLRCFKNFNHRNYINYRYDNNAWMTSLEFQNFLNYFNCEMKREKRNVVLLLDNASGHTIVESSNLKVVFLPVNTTNALPPLD